ncbi:HAD family hydrolase [Fusibacter ferrireducens]|uniref:HAD family phosphatase n=1 Tax=Fusibacter ferrireducens TaxID=2785058 RepID=A0ABS0A051_9FIRM|nr:HAD family phosphatase [Fusibacter ferrireducens]MBF4696084.1 HAD family phosphatase [Fusibacter ferrireducens]
MRKLEDIELVIFDMDGLMFDTEVISYKAWAKAADYYNYHMSKELFNRTIGTNLTRTREILMEYFGENFPFDLIKSERVIISNEIVNTDGVPIKKGLYELLEHLKKNKFKMAVATSTNRNRATDLLKLAKVDNYFDYVLCGDEVERSKPDPEIFIKVSKRLDCIAQRCVVIEDSENGILAAKRAGMIPIMIPDIQQPSLEIESLLFRKLENLKELINLL